MQQVSKHGQGSSEAYGVEEDFQFCFLDNLVLSAELLMLIGHGKEFLKLIFQVLALHQCEYDGLKLKTSVFMAAKYIINSAD